MRYLIWTLFGIAFVGLLTALKRDPIRGVYGLKNCSDL